jgi:PAS domain S-box-containing protein
VAQPPTGTAIGDLVVQLTAEGVVVVDGQYNVVLLNPAAERMTETASAEATGLKYTALMRFENATGQALDLIAGALMPGGKPERRDLVVVGRKSGKKTAVESVVTAFDGGAILSLRDITQELKEDSEQSEFISTASHEMRTPVASIRGFIELSLNPQTATIDERARGYLAKAQAASEHLGKLFQDLLDSTKLEDGRVKVNPKPLDFVAVTKRIADEMAPSIQQKGLTYRFGTAVEERQLERALYTRADPEFVAEIMSNLIENAVKYTKVGSITVTVNGDENYVYATVTDTGIGIAPGDAEHIFQKFYRADNSDTRTIGGTGLGLYISMKRAETMGGMLRLKSEVGRGSDFTLVLPRIDAAEYERQMLAEKNTWATAGKVVQ